MIIEWFRHIQTSMCKLCTSSVGPFVAVLMCVCDCVCVWRDGEYVVNVAAVELAKRKLSQAFKHQVSVEPIAVDQSGAGRWQLQPDQPVIQVTSWFLHTMFLQFLQQSDFFSSTLALTRSLSIFYAFGTCKRGLTHIMLLLSQGTINNISSQE